MLWVWALPVEAPAVYASSFTVRWAIIIAVFASAPEEGVAVFVVSNDDNAPVGPYIIAALEVLFPEQAAAEANKD